MVDALRNTGALDRFRSFGAVINVFINGDPQQKAAMLKTEQDLAARMSAVEIFSGDLAEFENLKGGQKFQIIDVPGRVKFLGGVSLRWQQYRREGDTYSYVLSRAVELSATAIIRYEQAGGFSDYARGIPIKPIVENTPPK